MKVTFKQSLAVLLVTLTLIGVQLVQASPLHDHLDHVADCVLCHGDSNEPALTTTVDPLILSVAAKPPILIANQPLISRYFTSFRSRAPPVLFT